MSEFEHPTPAPEWQPTVKPGYARRGEPIKWTVNAQVDKFTPEQVAEVEALLGRAPSFDELMENSTPETVHQPDNLLTTAGLTYIMGRLVANTNQAMDNTHTVLGVGDSTTAENANQTDLSASSNKYFMTMDATYPTVAGGVLTAKATFDANNGNFAWNEWGLVATTGAASAAASKPAGTLVNRKVASLGTKVNGAVWQLTVTLTLA